jgi:hypothetical protein
MSSSGLILRSFMVLGAVLVGLAASWAWLTITHVPMDWVSHAIALVLLSVALIVAQVVEGVSVDSEWLLARLAITTAIRVGLPLIGIVLLDRVLRPGFLNETLIFWLVGFTLGLIVACVLSIRRVSRESAA